MSAAKQIMAPLAVLAVIILNRFSLDSLLTLLPLCFAGYLIETRTQRPRRSYYRVGLLSAALFLLFAAFALGPGGSLIFAAIIWFGITLLIGIYTIHYERTEPLG